MKYIHSFHFKPSTLVLALYCIGLAPVFAQEATKLPPVVITADKDIYDTKDSSTATRTNTPIEHIPQSVLVVPKTMIEDQGAKTVSEALRNISNVNNVDARDSNNVGFKVRGFNAAVVMDGVTMTGYFPNQESLVNIEQIDVLKGPAGNVFGGGQAGGSYASLGGTIAFSSKAPQSVPSQEVGFSIGSYGQRSTNFDFNQPFSSTFAARLVGEVSRSDSESDGVFFRKKALMPSFAWTPNSDTSVTFRLKHLDNTTLDYSGLPTAGTLDTSVFTLPRSTNVTAVGLPDTTQKSNAFNLQWTQRLNSSWRFNFTTAKQTSTVDQRGVWLVDGLNPNGCFAYGSASPSAMNIACGTRLWDEFKTTTVSPNITGVFNFEHGKHTLSTGIDYEKTTDQAFMAYSNGFGALSMTPVAFNNPVYPNWVEPVAPTTPDQDNSYTSKIAYVQDQMDFGKVHVLTGIRYSQVDISDQNPSWLVNNQTKNTSFTPRFGIVLDISPAVNTFIGYNKGMKVPTGSIFTTPPKPETSTQIELGIKFKHLNGISGTVSTFVLNRLNAAVADPSNLGQSIQTGKQTSKGLDVDLRWKTSASLTWIAALTSQSAKISEDTNTNLVGKQLFNVPERAARIAARYDINKGTWAGLGFGLGLNHHSALPGNSTNTFFTQAATVWDAQVSYHTKSARYGLNVNNVLNKQYYVPSAYFSGGQVTPATPRTFTLTASFLF